FVKNGLIERVAGSENSNRLELDHVSSSARRDPTRLAGCIAKGVYRRIDLEFRRLGKLSVEALFSHARQPISQPHQQSILLRPDAHHLHAFASECLPGKTFSRDAKHGSRVIESKNLFIVPSLRGHPLGARLTQSNTVSAAA